MSHPNRPDFVRCETCVYWSRNTGGPENDYWGECRKSHPVFYLWPDGSGQSGVSTTFPTSNEDEWCGEWSDTWPGTDVPSKLTPWRPEAKE